MQDGAEASERRDQAWTAAAIVTFATLAACTRKNPDYCDTTADCDDGLSCLESSHTCIVPPDAASADAAMLCVGTNAYQICLESLPPSGALPINGALDTGTSGLCSTTIPSTWSQHGQLDACVVIAESLVVGTTNVTGPRPLVLVSTSSIAVNGTLDVASHADSGKSGPGSPSPSCGVAARAAVGTSGAVGAGGGAGGSFVSEGGSGGDGENGGAQGGLPAAAVTEPHVLRAGCPGEPGGTCNGGNTASGGDGGGAVFLVAADRITIAAGVTINASGAGAGPSFAPYCGGAGGGSGGMIVISAPAINAAGAVLMANGGGGSSGAEDSGDGNASPGDDPPVGQPMVVAAGGSGSDQAGNGGFGWALAAYAQPGGPGPAGRGGGGGGGGQGYIQTSVAVDAECSPAALIVP